MIDAPAPDPAADAGRHPMLDLRGGKAVPLKKAVDEVEARTKKLLGINGKRSPDSFHKELGKVCWENCGMARNEAGLKEALRRIPELRAAIAELLVRADVPPRAGRALAHQARHAGGHIGLRRLMAEPARS